LGLAQRSTAEQSQQRLLMIHTDFEAMLALLKMVDLEQAEHCFSA
jgi:hypothetical protein